VHFNGVFEIVNVDELYVKLVVQMFNVLELVFGEVLFCGLLKTAFVFCKFFPVLTKFFSPGIALRCEL